VGEGEKDLLQWNDPEFTLENSETNYFLSAILHFMARSCFSLAFHLGVGVREDVKCFQHLPSSASVKPALASVGLCNCFAAWLPPLVMAFHHLER
jgi:hypothetical protein